MTTDSKHCTDLLTILENEKIIRNYYDETDYCARMNAVARLLVVSVFYRCDYATVS